MSDEEVTYSLPEEADEAEELAFGDDDPDDAVDAEDDER